MSMQTAYTLAGVAVRHRLQRERPDMLAMLDGVRSGEIATFDGSYDRVQGVLDALKVPYATNPTLDARSVALAFANCSSGQHAKLRRARAYVEAGGWLVSSDWSLDNVVAKHFPGTICKHGTQNTGDEVVGVEPDLKSTWSDVVVLGVDAQWWLENASYPIEIVDPERVTVEAASHELLAKYGAPAVAARFDWEKGHVFHVISHFWHKRSRSRGGIYDEPGEIFLARGMRFDEAGIDAVLAEAKVKRGAVRFAELQTAVTSAELVSRLCVEAVAARRETAGHTRPRHTTYREWKAAQAS